MVAQDDTLRPLVELSEQRFGWDLSGHACTGCTEAAAAHIRMFVGSTSARNATGCRIVTAVVADPVEGGCGRPALG